MLAAAISLAWLFSGVNDAPVAVGNPPDYSIEQREPVAIEPVDNVPDDGKLVQTVSVVECTPFGCRVVDGPAMRQMGGSSPSGNFVRGQPVRNVFRAVRSIFCRR